MIAGRKQRIVRTFSFAACLVFLSSCALSLIDPAAVGIFQRGDENLIEKNYAAADFLVQQAQTFIRRQDVVKAVPLIDADEPRIAAPIGKIIPEQIAIRFSQLGYRTDISEVSTAGDQVYLQNAFSQKTDKPDFVLSGTYMRKFSDLFIALRMTNTRNGQIIASFDYTLPYTRDLGERSEPETQIIRMPQGQ